MIRKHTPEDLEIILQIWRSANDLAHHFLKDDFVKQVADAMRNIYIPGSDTWVFVKDDVVVGFISMINNEIGGLFVDPLHHSGGIGSHLVNHVRSMHNTLEVEVFEKNSIGRAFYQKQEFRQFKSYFHEASEEMVLRLTNSQT